VLTLAGLNALEALCAARGRPVTVRVGVPFNERVLRALRRLRGDAERSTTMRGFNNEVLRLLGQDGATVVEPSVRAVSSKSSSYPITLANIQAGTSFEGTTTLTFTLPAASGWAGRSVRIANAAAVGSGVVVTVDGNGSETVGGDLTMTLNPGDGHIYESDGSNIVVY